MRSLNRTYIRPMKGGNRAAGKTMAPADKVHIRRAVAPDPYRRKNATFTGHSDGWDHVRNGMQRSVHLP